MYKECMLKAVLGQLTTPFWLAAKQTALSECPCGKNISEQETVQVYDSLHVVLLLGKMELRCAWRQLVVRWRIIVACGRPCCQWRSRSAMTLFLDHASHKAIGGAPFQHDEAAHAVRGRACGVVVEGDHLVDAHCPWRKRLRSLQKPLLDTFVGLKGESEWRSVDTVRQTYMGGILELGGKATGAYGHFARGQCVHDLGREHLQGCRGATGRVQLRRKRM